jgi:uncharacterized membrane protein
VSAMTRRQLLARLDAAQVEQAIARAERTAAIELRISIAGLFWGSAQRVADRAFARMGMTATRGRNGLLLFIAPWRRRVVIVADRGITEKAGAALWPAAVAAVTTAFRERRYTEGLVAAIDGLAAALAPHLPPVPGDVNELPDRIDR